MILLQWGEPCKGVTGGWAPLHNPLPGARGFLSIPVNGLFRWLADKLTPGFFPLLPFRVSLCLLWAVPKALPCEREIWGRGGDRALSFQLTRVEVPSVNFRLQNRELGGFRSQKQERQHINSEQTQSALRPWRQVS